MGLPSRHKRIASFTAILLLVSLACNLPLPSVEQLPSIEGSQPASKPTEAPEPAAAEPILVAHLEPEFILYSLDGTKLESRSAEGLDYARPNTAQVVGGDIFYVWNQGPEQGSVVRRVGPADSEALEFTRSTQGESLAFTVSPDGERIAWSSTAWEGTAPASQLWQAAIDGSESELVTETDPSDAIDEWFVLEPVEWLESGDLVYAWQVTGIGGYILFYGWSSLYRFTPTSGTTASIAPAPEEVGAPCWTDVTQDAAYAAGSCGPESEVIELAVTSGLETLFPTLPDQGQAGTAVYSPSGDGLAYSVARGDPEHEAGQAVARSGRSQAPAAVATQEPGYFSRLLWIDEQRLAASTATQDTESVEVLGLDGGRSPVGAGRLVGIMWIAPAQSPAQSAAGPCIEEQLALGDLVLEDIRSTGDLVGPGMDLVVRNPGSEEVATCVPCGTVFAPKQGDSQQMLAVQLTEAVIPAGGEATLTAYVTCIEARSDVPDGGEAYTFGPAPDAKLQAFAQCACEDDLTASRNPLDPMSVLFAGWMIGEGSSFSDMIESDSGGALGDFLGSDAGETLAGVIGVIEGPAKDRLEACGIQP